MKKNSQVIFMSFGLSMALGLSACSVSVDGGDGGKKPPPIPKPQASLTGTWVTGCTADDQGNHQIETLSFRNGEFSNEISIYGNEGCHAEPIAHASMKGSYTSKATAKSVQGTIDIDVVIDQQGEKQKYFLLALIKDRSLYLPPVNHDSSRSRAKKVDMKKPYFKIGG